MAHLIKRKEGTPYWISYIRQRIKNNKNFLCFISGPTGSGKSWSSLRIAEDLDPQFSIERVVFNGRELMSLINSNKLNKGSVIVFEEAGVEMSNRSWQSMTNKLLNFLLQTFRHRNFVLIFNSPYMDFVDAGTRKLFHAEMSTAGIDKEKKTVKLKPLCIQYNGRFQKFYYKRLRVRTDKGLAPVTFWHVGEPSQELLEAYEKRKREFTDGLNAEIQGELDRLHGIIKKPLTQKQQDVLDLLKKRKNTQQVADELGISPEMVNAHMKFIRKKGFELSPVKEGTRILYYEVQ